MTIKTPTSDSKETGFFKEWIAYLKSFTKILLIVGFVGGITGLLVAWFQKPTYTAEITFAPETDKGGSMGIYAGIAAQFGVDLGLSGGSIFEGDNLTEFLHSKMLIQRALLSSSAELQNGLVINHYIESHKLKQRWKSKPQLQRLDFSSVTPPSRLKDSVLNLIIMDLKKQLVIKKVDPTLNIVSAKMSDEDEVFSKVFVEQLVARGIEYYVDYRSKKSRENVAILQKQTDSVMSMMTGSIVSVAQSSDLNVNPIRQIVRANIQRKQVDVQVNGQLYGELLKQLELAKITLRKETPLIQIIDTPTYPLEKKKLGRLLGALAFSFFFLFTALGILALKKLLRN